MDFGKLVDRTTNIAAVIFTAIGAWYARAAFIASTPTAQTGQPVNDALTPSWAIALLCVGFVLSLLSVARLFGWIRPNVKMTDVYKKQFANEIVILDNHRFYECQFNSVTFRYRGGPWRFVKPQFSGLTRFEVQSVPIKNAIDFLKYQGWLSQAFGESWRELPPEHFK